MYRRKCEDESPPEKPFRITRKIGAIGPVRLILAGYSALAFVPFHDGDPDGARYLAESAARKSAAEAALLALPTAPRIDPETFEEILALECPWAAE